MCRVDSEARTALRLKVVKDVRGVGVRALHHAHQHVV